MRVNSALAPAVGAAEEVVITQRPVVDVGSSGTTTTVDSEMLKRVPLSAPGSKGAASRTFESVAEVAPGANNDLYGAGVNGATSPENHYSVDGLSVGNPGKGTLGTTLSTEFVQEVNVVSAGYMPEYGRATGGMLNVVTKSGSNNFHGSVFTFFSPGALEGDRKLVQQSAQPVAYATELSYIGDVGFDLGGPIIKDKLWFYTGFDVSNTAYNIKRGHLPDPGPRLRDRERWDDRDDAHLLPDLHRRLPHRPGHGQADLVAQRRQPPDPGGLRHARRSRAAGPSSTGRT